MTGWYVLAAVVAVLGFVAWRMYVWAVEHPEPAWTPQAFDDTDELGASGEFPEPSGPVDLALSIAVWIVLALMCVGIVYCGGGRG